MGLICGNKLVVPNFDFFEEFTEGKIVSVTFFTSFLGTLKYLPIFKVVYVYDTIYGTTIILDNNNTIYLGNQMEYLLGNTIQLVR